MSNIPSLSFRRSTHFAILLILAALFPISVSSQTYTDSTSLRGSAKINGTLVATGIMVVVVPKAPEGAPGKPRSAYVNGVGEYRIEDLSPGHYKLVASGKPIKEKVLPDVKIEPGNSNIQNLVLVRRELSTNIKTRLIGPTDQPIQNAKVKIYSSELPPSFCEDCVLAESTSNEAGEVEYSDLGGEQAYRVAISYYDEENKREVKLIASDLISIGSQTQARVELRIAEGANPVLTAKLLPDIHPSRSGERPGTQLATAPDSEKLGRSVALGTNQKIKGVVVARYADTFVVRDMEGVDTVVRLEDETSVKTKGGFLRGGTNYGQTSILRGLNLEVTGTGNKEGELAAKKIRFNESDFRVARAMESRANPLEERASDTEHKLAQVEANAQRLSGQLEELAAVSNAARGGSKAAQATADAAVAGVNATNERISSLDDYTPQITAAVNFRSGSAELSAESKTTLDDIARKALDAKGYVLEISGFADSRGSVALNRSLAQRRADAVIRYLVENHNIPLRRIVTPYSYGELNPVAENTSREGRAENRRVEIKLLVNKGLVAPTPTMRP